MEDCLFCKILSGKISTKKIYEDDKALAFEDISPQAPVHVLVIPKKHIVSLDNVGESDVALLGHIQFVISRLARKNKLFDGYRVVNNCGVYGGQTVQHLHYHLLGGRVFGWPPG